MAGSTQILAVSVQGCGKIMHLLVWSRGKPVRITFVGVEIAANGCALHAGAPRSEPHRPIDQMFAAAGAFERK